MSTLFLGARLGAAWIQTQMKESSFRKDPIWRNPRSWLGQVWCQSILAYAIKLEGIGTYFETHEGYHAWPHRSWLAWSNRRNFLRKGSSWRKKIEWLRVFNPLEGWMFLAFRTMFKFILGINWHFADCWNLKEVLGGFWSCNWSIYSFCIGMVFVSSFHPLSSKWLIFKASRIFISVL